MTTLPLGMTKTPLSSRPIYENTALVDSTYLKGSLTGSVESCTSRDVSPSSTIPMSDASHPIHSTASSAKSAGRSGSKRGMTLYAHMKTQPRVGVLDEKRVQHRVKQVLVGKQTFGHAAFQRLVEVGTLDKHVPSGVRKQCKTQVELYTFFSPPSVTAACSNRAFDGYLREWRQKLHLFDRMTPEDLRMTTQDFAAMVAASDVDGQRESSVSTVGAESPGVRGATAADMRKPSLPSKKASQAMHFRVSSDPTISSEASSK
jgi:hypothetical protein